jgi:hypothetical protein
MSLYVGNDAITDLYVGVNRVRAAYVGSQNIYTWTPPAPVYVRYWLILTNSGSNNGEITLWNLKVDGVTPTQITPAGVQTATGTNPYFVTVASGASTTIYMSGGISTQASHCSFSTGTYFANGLDIHAELWAEDTDGIDNIISYTDYRQSTGMNITV